MPIVCGGGNPGIKKPFRVFDPHPSFAVFGWWMSSSSGSQGPADSWEELESGSGSLEGSGASESPPVARVDEAKTDEQVPAVRPSNGRRRRERRITENPNAAHVTEEKYRSEIGRLRERREAETARDAQRVLEGRIRDLEARLAGAKPCGGKNADGLRKLHSLRSKAESKKEKRRLGRKIDRTRNTTFNKLKSKDTIDLHGQTAATARARVRDVLDTPKDGPQVIIVGRGIHSKDGHAVVRETVADELARRGVPYDVQAKGGAFVIGGDPSLSADQSLA